MAKRINIVLFGIGKAGSALINKVIKGRKNLVLEHGLDLRFPVITNSTVAFFEKEGANYSWEANFIQFAIPFKMEDVVKYVLDNNLENLIAVDATSSPELVKEYVNFVENGFNIISINEALPALPQGVVREVGITALTRGLEYVFLDLPKGDASAAAEALLVAILNMAEKKKEVA